MSRGDAEQFPLVERRDRSAVELVAAVREIAVVADGEPQVFGPVDHRRQRRGGRQPEPHRGGRREVAALHDRVGEVRGADHHRVHRLGASFATRRALSRARRRRPSSHPASSPI